MVNGCRDSSQRDFIAVHILTYSANSMSCGTSIALRDKCAARGTLCHARQRSLSTSHIGYVGWMVNSPSTTPFPM